MNHHQNNISRIVAVYRALEELAKDVIFVGGATVSLYADRQAEEIRPTDDIDILIEVTAYQDYASIEQEIRKKGFVNDVSSPVICRYLLHDIIVDIMPTDKNVLGFANRWYEDGFKYSIEHTIGDGINIRIFSPPYFLASKIEAFDSRGGGDGRSSSDFEDIVYFLNNNHGIWSELTNLEEELKNYMIEKFSAFLNRPHFEEWITSNLEYSEQSRGSFIIGKMKEFVAANS